MKTGRQLDTLVAETFGLPSADYSTDISAACELMDAIIGETGGYFELYSGYGWESAKLSIAPCTYDADGIPNMGKPVIYSSRKYDQTHDISGSGMAQAICEVALKAKASGSI